jgi:hypothetical protein
VGIDLFLLWGEQIQQQRPETCASQHLGDKFVARGVTAASAPVSEHHDAACALGNGEVSL